jgi:hypothetical protein
MADRWIFDGSIDIGVLANPGPVHVLRGAAEVWFTRPVRALDRHSLSLSCVDRRLLLGDGSVATDGSFTVRPIGRRDHVGCHVETCGHPADNERVIRRIPQVECTVRYARDAVRLAIACATLPGELSRDDHFQADRSPWAIRIALQVPRREVAGLLALSDRDARLIEHRFETA